MVGCAVCDDPGWDAADTESNDLGGCAARDVGNMGGYDRNRGY